MTEREIIMLRENLLGGMDSYICDLGDESIWERWIANGVPDCATEDDLEWIARNEDEFAYVCKLFGKLVYEEWEER